MWRRNKDQTDSRLGSYERLEDGDYVVLVVEPSQS
jgi:hypothetical protein